MSLIRYVRWWVFYFISSPTN